jgi:hypothetical protein
MVVIAADMESVPPASAGGIKTQRAVELRIHLLTQVVLTSSRKMRVLLTYAIVTIA